MIEPKELQHHEFNPEGIVSDAYNSGAENSAQVYDDEECARFQAQMAERIGAGENLSDTEHMQKCERCRALLSDLESIVAAVREIFPAEEPRDELWDQIQLAIARGEA